MVCLAPKSYYRLLNSVYWILSWSYKLIIWPLCYRCWTKSGHSAVVGHLVGRWGDQTSSVSRFIPRNTAICSWLLPACAYHSLFDPSFAADIALYCTTCDGYKWVEFEVYCNCHLISGKKILFCVALILLGMQCIVCSVKCNPKKKCRVKLGELWLGLRFIRANCINAFVL